MTWLMDHSAPSKISDTKLERVASLPNGCAAVQRDLKRLDKWADMNLMTSAKGAAKSCT